MDLTEARGNDAASPAEWRAAESLLVHEGHLLDERRFEEWVELFTEDGYYWAPSVPDQKDPLNTVSLIYDDRAAMSLRIRRLRHPAVHSQSPQSRTTHVVSNVHVEKAARPGVFDVRSKFLVYEYRASIPDPVERIFAGTYYHSLVASGSGLKIASQKAVLSNCDAMIAPFAVYF